jgi:hypothetical protein
MRKIREVLRLKFESGRAHREIAASWTGKCGKASRKHSAGDITFELIAHERRQRRSEALLDGGVEREQVFAHHLVQGSALWPAPFVGVLARGARRSGESRHAPGRAGHMPGTPQARSSEVRLAAWREPGGEVAERRRDRQRPDIRHWPGVGLLHSRTTLAPAIRSNSRRRFSQHKL